MYLARQADSIGRQDGRDAAVVRAAEEERLRALHQLRAGQAGRQGRVSARVGRWIAPQCDLRCRSRRAAAQDSFGLVCTAHSREH
jgi:hypothetical protein